MPEYIGSPDDWENSAEDDGRDYRDSDEYFFETIAVAYHLGILKNDIKSPCNHLTGLEQVIDYAFQYAPPLVTLNDLKSMVFDKMEWAQQVCEMKSAEDYLGLIVGSSRGADDDIEEKREEYYKGILIGIANYMLSKQITDDVRSSNGLSPLEQIIMFYLGYMQKNRLKVIKNNIYSLYKGWEGGSSIPNIDYSCLIKKFPKSFP